MSKFVLAREVKGKKPLPGNPVAIVKSSTPSLDGLFLCTVDVEDSDSDDSDSDQEELAGKKRKRKPDTKADVEEVLKKTPQASVAAEKFAEDFGRGKRHPAGRQTPAEKKVGKPSAKADFVRLPPGSMFEPLPCVSESWRTTQYAAGKSGSGKSYYMAGLIRRYMALFPGRPVYGFCLTKFKDDPAYADLDIKQLPASFFADALDLEKAFGSEGCFILYDDWDAADPAEKRIILASIANVLTVGRKLQLSVGVTSHLLTNYKETRIVIHEADYVTVFPRSCQYNSLKYLCDKMGIPKEVTARLRRKGLWVSFHNSKPTFVLSETEAEMI